MKKGIKAAAAASILFVLVLEGVSCTGTGESPRSGDLIFSIAPGDEWMHEFSRTRDNPPQFAIWIEDEGGNYLQTVFATRKIATEGWIFNKGNRRVESLPRWMHKRDIQDSEGVLLPSREEPLADGISGATPKSEFSVLIRPEPGMDRFRVILEINHSTDFNGAWPENASPGEAGWSGGSMGSGQPSLVYSALVDTSGTGPWNLSLDGHGSPDGSDGGLYADVSSFTTALDILEKAEARQVP